MLHSISMAIEAVSPDIPLPAMSPRISFSHDFIQTESIPVEQRPNSRSNSSAFNSSFDFDFCECPDQESSSADEIFSHGKILPLQIKKKSDEPHLRVDRSSSSSNRNSPPLTRAKSLDANVEKRLKKDRSAKEIKPASSDAEEKQGSNSSNSKSFWHFKRSSSCGSGYTRSLCPLPLLSRSNSTGSAPNMKRTPLSKDGVTQKQTSHRNASKINSQMCSSSMPYQKPPLKKVHGLYGNGVQVNPILNVHSGNLFGLGSIFSSGKKK